MIRLEELINQWLRPAHDMPFLDMLHRGDIGQRFVGAVVVAHLPLLREKPGWPCVARTTSRLMRRGLTGEWALATRLTLSLLEPGDPLYSWKNLLGRRSQDVRGLDYWLTTSETCLRHFGRLPPGILENQASTTLANGLDHLCDALAEASRGLAFEGRNEATTLVYDSTQRISMSPILEIQQDSIRLWAGMTRRREALFTRLVSDSDGAIRLEEARAPDESRSHNPFLMALEAASLANPLEAFASDAANEAIDVQPELVSTDDPQETAENLANTWRSIDRPVIVIEASAWETPMETLAATLGFTGDADMASVIRAFDDWSVGAEGARREKPVVLLAGTGVRHTQFDSLRRSLGDKAIATFVTDVLSHDLYWPNHSRNRVRLRDSDATTSSSSPLTVRVLQRAGASPMESWREAAMHEFGLRELLNGDPQRFGRIAAVVRGQGDALSEPSVLAWLSRGLAMVGPDGSLGFVHPGWHDLWAGLTGDAANDGPAAEAGRALRMSRGTVDERAD